VEKGVGVGPTPAFPVLPRPMKPARVDPAQAQVIQEIVQDLTVPEKVGSLYSHSLYSRTL
jgi:hypothetical protein